MGIVEAIVFGIVQGLTEFLPISSTAHLRIVPTLFGWQDPGAAFTAVIQLGTVLAVLIYFAKDLGRAFSAWARSLTGKGRDTVDAQMGWAVFWGTIPVIVFGFLFKEQIKSNELRSLYVIAGTLIVMGVLMLVAEKFGKKDRDIGAVRVRDGIIVGLWQCLALIPGMSRSGSTITGAMFAGFDRSTAARFSFLLSVPSIAAAGLYELYDERAHILGQNLTPVIVATIVSFIVGYASIAFLIKFLQKHGVGVFVAYRILLALILLALLGTGTLQPQSGTPDEAAAPSARTP